MSAHLAAVCFAAHDPARLAHFWSGVFGVEVAGDGAGAALLPDGDTGFVLRFRGGAGPKVHPNPMHFDLTSASAAEQQDTVARAVALGARHIDVGQRPEDGHVVLADPEGNEFCVIEAGNTFLADCGFLGAVACDGSRAVGEFWSRALDWPLVWDQGEETAIRSPAGGPKISWGGTPSRDASVDNRVRFELAPSQAAPEVELARLVSLGARRIGGDPATGQAVLLADPDGNGFCLLDS